MALFRRSKQGEKTAPLRDKDYERIGHLIYPILEEGFLNHRKIYKTAFFRGAVTGFGSILGATIGLGLFLWFLSLFDTVPFVESLVHNIKDTIESNKPR